EVGCTAARAVDVRDDGIDGENQRDREREVAKLRHKKTRCYCDCLGLYLEGQLVITWVAAIAPSAPSLPSTITSRPGANMSGLGSPADTTRNETGSDATTGLIGAPDASTSGIGTISNLRVSVFGSQLIVPAFTRPATRSAC